MKQWVHYLVDLMEGNFNLIAIYIEAVFSSIILHVYLKIMDKRDYGVLKC